MESGILLRRPTTASGAPARSASSTKTPVVLRRLRRGSTAKDGWPRARDMRGSLRSILSSQFSESLLSFVDVVQSELAGFHQMRHHRLGPATEQAQQFVD